MIVCICENVSSSVIKRMAAEGCNLQQIQRDTKACTNCQICRQEVCDIIDVTQGRPLEDNIFNCRK